MPYNKKKALRGATLLKNPLPATKKACWVSSTNIKAEKSLSNAKTKEPETLAKATLTKTILTQINTLRRRFSLLQ